MSRPNPTWQQNWPWILPIGAVVVWLLPALIDLLILDRGSVRRGELWRWGTFPVVHLSASHLAINVVVTATLLWAGRPALDRIPAWGWLGLIVGPGAGALIAEPDLNRLAGLSALNVGLALWMGLEWISQGSKRMGWWCLAITVLKLGVEAAGLGGLTRYDQPGVRTCLSCHAAAALIALCGWWLAHRKSQPPFACLGENANLRSN